MLDLRLRIHIQNAGLQQIEVDLEIAIRVEIGKELNAWRIGIKSSVSLLNRQRIVADGDAMSGPDSSSALKPYLR
jgi:hypothetical protein